MEEKVCQQVIGSTYYFILVPSPEVLNYSAVIAYTSLASKLIENKRTGE